MPVRVCWALDDDLLVAPGICCTEAGQMLASKPLLKGCQTTTMLLGARALLCDILRGCLGNRDML